MTAAASQSASQSASPEQLLVLLASPTDTQRAERLFAQAAVRAHGCRDLRHLCEALGDETGAVLVAEEFVLGDGNGQLAAALAAQPAWSALPLVVLTRGDASDRLAVLQARASVNLTLIERPVRTATLVSVVQAALRARRQQYALRDSLATQARADAARGASEDRLAFALQAADLGQWDLNLADRTVQRTARYDQIFGYSTQLPEWTYERFLEHVLPEDRAAVDADFQAAVVGGPPWDIECRIRRADGAIHWIWAKAGIVRDAAGRAERMLGVMGDLTARKDAEAAIRAGQQALREAARRKDEFLATLAHELRNPLAPIRTGLKILTRMPTAHTASAAEQVCEMMDRQLRQMVRLVDDLLDVSRITLGKIELHRERLRLGDAVLAAVETSRPLIEAGSHQLALSGLDEAIWLDADLTRLAQVLANVLGNAAKFTPAGGRIELAVQREGREAIVTVSDPGIGIAPEQIGQVFEMFSQAQPSIDRAQGGLGIGLALVRRLIELHGGHVTAASAGANRGTTITIRLPVAPDHESPADAANRVHQAIPIGCSPKT